VFSSESVRHFERDRDRIVGLAAFRRLAGKTQVIALPGDPLVRTRLTHTLEVSSIAREIGRALGMCDPLVEAIALGHDLGHPAFGHAGECALDRVAPGGFHHARQSVRVLRVLEPTHVSPEVEGGVLRHSKGPRGAVFLPEQEHAFATDEARLVRACDLYAYACHDLDDAFWLGLLEPGDTPAFVRAVLGHDPATLRASLVRRTVLASSSAGCLSLDSEACAALEDLRAFLYENLYESPRVAEQTALVAELVLVLHEAAIRSPDLFAHGLERLGVLSVRSTRPAISFVDAVATMTDRQAFQLYLALRPGQALPWPRATFSAVTGRRGGTSLNADDRSPA
jgi:dGTPase